MKVTCYISLHWKTKLERNQVKPFLKFITRPVRIEWKIYWGSKMKNKEEVKDKVCMHWNSGFCKESQCNYVHTDEDCYIHLQVWTWRYSKCRDRHEQTGTYRLRQGQTRTYRVRQGQTRIDKDRQGQAWTDRDNHEQIGTSRDKKGMSLFVPVYLCLSLPCPCLSLLDPALSLAFTGIIGK